jgi:hypothetical protein
MGFTGVRAAAQTARAYPGEQGADRGELQPKLQPWEFVIMLLQAGDVSPGSSYRLRMCPSRPAPAMIEARRIMKGDHEGPLFVARQPANTSCNSQSESCPYGAKRCQLVALAARRTVWKEANVHEHMAG